MHKEEFLSKLEKKLKILNESEKKDIINEHRTIIDEKIKNGQSEEAAIADFGDVNELAKEILRAYKVDPDYNKSSESFEKTKESFDEGVKNAAEWLSEKSQDFFDSVGDEESDITLGKIFEIMIKVFVVIILLYIFRIPFSILASLGAGVFAVTIFPFSLFQYLWIVVVEVLYITTIIITFFLMFKNDIFTEKKTTSNMKKESSKQKTAPKKTTSKKGKKAPSKETPPSDVGLIIFKIFVVLVFIIPLIIFASSLTFSLAVLIFFLFQGVVLTGLILMNLALLGFVFLIIHVLLSLFNNTKPSVWSLIPISIFFILGIIFTVDWAFNLSIVSEEKDELTKETLVITQEELAESTYWRNYEIRIDPEVEEGMVVVDIYYNKKYENLVVIDDQGGVVVHLGNLREAREFSRVFVAGLKEDEIRIPYYEIKLYAQEETIQELD